MEYLKKNWNNWNWNALQNYISPKKQEYQLSKPKKMALHGIGRPGRKRQL